MKCKCCGNIVSSGITCSTECGMMFRYLSGIGLSDDEIREVCDKTTNASDMTPKYRYKMFLLGLPDKPKCEICEDPIPYFKGPIENEFKKTCSRSCAKTLTIINKERRNGKKCLVCSTNHHKTSSTCSIGCGKTLQCVKGQFPNIDISKIINHPLTNLTFKERAICVANNVNEMPTCRNCGIEYFRTCAWTIKETCSVNCRPKTKYNHTCEGCNTEFTTSRRESRFCTDECSRKRNYKNTELLTEDYVRQNFIEDGTFKTTEFLAFFGVSDTTMYRIKKQFNITEKNDKSVEQDIFNLYSDIAISNDRTVIYPKEIDILFPGYKFGIEYDGLVWHSQGNDSYFPNVDKNFHLDKTNLMEEYGYQLFHIFENEWLTKRDIWLSVIDGKLGRTKRIYARKCEIREVQAKEARSFLEDNHLQGSVNSPIRYGLYYDGGLVSLMTFGKSRYKKDIEYELVRFCSKIGHTVVGGASKLLKYFERMYKPKSIISYANRRWSQGNLYKKLGFEFTHSTPPNYFYFKNDYDELHSRVKFQKHKLKDMLETFNPDLSETENMFNNGYRKIYDCGNHVFIKRYN